jgi:hypothetical protein
LERLARDRYLAALKKLFVLESGSDLKLFLRIMCYNIFMHRLFLTLFLAVSLCQNFCPFDAEMISLREGHCESGINECTVLQEIVGTVNAVSVFWRIYTPDRPFFDQVRSLRQERVKVAMTAWIASAPGQKRRIYHAVHPQELGMIILQLPRCDG